MPGLIERYRDRLPVTDATPVIELGEGSTPLLAAPRISELTASSLRDRPRMLGGGQNISRMVNDLWAGAPIDGCSTPSMVTVVA